jgi:phage recombination protein Bet
MAKPTASVPATRDHEFVAYKSRSGLEITLTLEVVRNYLVTGKKELVSLQELIFFMGVCKARGLNPFARECYLIKYTQDDPAAIITSIDFYRSRARAQEDCVGWKSGVIVRGKDGNIRRTSGLVLSDEELVGGWFTAQPKKWEVEFDLEVSLEGYIKKTSSGAITRFWRKEMQPTMIRKVAESQGLRELWPDEFRGTVAAEELGEISELLTAASQLEPLAEEPPAPPPTYDTTKFHELVDAKLREMDADRQKICAAHLLVYLQESAERKAKYSKKETWTPERIMAEAAPYFEPYTIPEEQAKKDKLAVEQPGFWKRFLNWETLPEHPWNEKKLPLKDESAEGPAGAEAPPPGAAATGRPEPAEEESLQQRIDRVWQMAVDKYPKLKDMKAALGIAGKKDLTAENIAEIEAKLAEA